MVIGLTVGMIVGLFKGLASGLTIGLAFGLSVGLSRGLSEALTGLDNHILQTGSPQQRVVHAAGSGLPLFLMISTTATLLFVTIITLSQQTGFATGVYDGNILYAACFATSITAFLALGIDTLLQYYLVRVLLWQEKQLPLRLVCWLEMLQKRKVLQRVGGSYHFLHKQLQEYLAAS